jgi:hypothetical protein
MTDTKTARSKNEAAAARAAKKAAEEADAERAEKELRARRASQLESINEAVERIGMDLKALRKCAKRCEELLNHSGGFYDEINKLAKGKALVEATHLAVNLANDIVRDAKEIVRDDVYLDRTKEFVPAGDNPVYPDVPLTIRAVRQSLGGCQKDLERQKKQFYKTLSRAKTVVGALECFLSEDENGEYALKDDVEAHVDGAVDDSCFSWNGDSRVHYFNFNEFDAQSLEEYLTTNEPNAESEDASLDIDEALASLEKTQEEEE